MDLFRKHTWIWKVIVAISSLFGIDKVKTALSRDGGDLIVSFPYKEGEIEKVSYTLEDGYLNIVVKAGEQGLSFIEQDVKYKRLGGLPTLLFVVGTPRLSDLGDLFDPEVLKDTTVVNIDNKADNQGFGDIVMVSPRYSSVSEQIADLLLFLGMHIDVDAAQNLLSGISFATNNFQDPKTSVLAFEMVAMLLKSGAVRPKQSVDRAVRDTASSFGSFGSHQQSKAFPQQRQHQQQAPRPMDFSDKTQQFTPKNLPSQPRQQTQSFDKQSASVNKISQPAVGKQNAPIEEKDAQDTPPDWLAPKVYKSSTLI